MYNACAETVFLLRRLSSSDVMRAILFCSGSLSPSSESSATWVLSISCSKSESFAQQRRACPEQPSACSACVFSTPPSPSSQVPNSKPTAAIVFRFLFCALTVQIGTLRRRKFSRCLFNLNWSRSFSVSVPCDRRPTQLPFLRRSPPAQLEDPACSRRCAVPSSSVSGGLVLGRLDVHLATHPSAAAHLDCL